MKIKQLDYTPVHGLWRASDAQGRMWKAYEKAMSCKTWEELREVCREDGLHLPRPDEGGLERLNARQPGRPYAVDVHRAKDFRCARAEVGEVLLLAAWNVVEPGGYEDWQDNQRDDFAARLRDIAETGGGTSSERLGVSWEDPGNWISERWGRNVRASYKTGRLEGSKEGSPFVSVRREAPTGKSWAALVSENVRRQLVSGD